jgi:dihydroflavonol-4-reductase
MDWAGEKVLVLGGSGFLGANIVHCLVTEKGVRPQNIRTLSNRATHALDDLPGVDQMEGDILDPAVVVRACEGRTIVFHAAGSATFDPRLKRQQWLANVEGTRNVLDAVRASRTVRRLCCTSTVNVLGCPRPDGAAATEESSSPYTSRPRLHSFSCPEDALALADAVHAGSAPRSWWKRLRIGYFDSKLAAQELVNRAARAHALEVVSVLPGTCFGAYGEAGDAARLIAAVMRGAIPAAPRGGLPLAHVHDVARGHVLAVERGSSGAMYIVSGKPEDNRRHADMMAIIAEVVGIKARFPVLPAGLVWLAAAASEARALILRQPAALSRQAALASRYALFYSSARAEKELGYVPQRTFREAVELMYHSLKCGGTP